MSSIKIRKVNIYPEHSSRITTVLTETGLKPVGLARKIKCASSTLSMIQSGQRQIGIGIAGKINRWFGYSVEWLTEGIGEKFDPSRVESNSPGEEMPPDIYERLLNQSEAILKMKDEMSALKDEVRGLRDDMRKLVVELAKGRPPRSGAAVKTETEKSI